MTEQSGNKKTDNAKTFCDQHVLKQVPLFIDRINERLRTDEGPLDLGRLVLKHTAYPECSGENHESVLVKTAVTELNKTGWSVTKIPDATANKLYNSNDVYEFSKQKKET